MTACTLIENSIGYCRMATLDADGFPASLRYFDDPALSPVGGVFDARVTGLDSASDMAFLDLDGQRSGAMNLRRAKLLARGKAETIHDCVTEGQMVRVQVIAESSPEEGKALSVTPRPRLMGRYCVVETGGKRLNFSKDLKPHVVGALKTVLAEAADMFAVIIRTLAGAVSPEITAQEAQTFAAILSRPLSDAPTSVWVADPLAQALAATDSTATDILFCAADDFNAARTLAKTTYPDLTDRLTLQKNCASLMEEYGINEAIEEATAPRIALPSGGWITVTPTPALTAIDVNMGAAMRGRSAADAKRLVNMEAALAVAWHLKFQDIGGLIVVDFIDMSGKGALKDLMDVFDDAVREDTVPVQRSGISAFGLMEISRKRSGLGLRDRFLLSRAPADRVSALCLGVLDRAIRVGGQAGPGTLVIQAPKSAYAYLDSHSQLTQKLAARTARRIELRHGPSLDVFLET